MPVTVRSEILESLIIGGGIAGLTAAMYLGRWRRHPVVIGGQLGGQLINITNIENYPGFTSVAGYQLISNLRSQAESSGALIYEDMAVAVDLSLRDSHDRLIAQVWTLPEHEALPILHLPSDQYRQRATAIKNSTPPTYKAHTLLLATGAKRNKLNVSGEEQFIGRGISWCATCDAMFFRNKTVAVVGSGNSAAEEVLILSRLANKVFWLVRNDQIKADAILKKRISNKDNVETIFNTTVTEVVGSQKVEGLKITTTSPNSAPTPAFLPIDGVFIAIGLQAASLLVADQLALRPDGHINAHNCTGTTSVSGVFAAGDVEQEWQQLVVAAGRGARAAGSAEEYLSKLESP
ncbi:FAD-dependent oxidoreductase [Microgenomates group bacterium]|nr:FAD-dependent oxidoreductase [Microgenomates group bacterium]